MQAAVEAERAAAGRTTTAPGVGCPPESAVSGGTGPEETVPANGTNQMRNGAAAAGRPSSRGSRGAGPGFT